MVASTAPQIVRPAEGLMEVFSLVSVEGHSVPDVAAKLRIPPEKVRQSRDQVLTWLATNKPLLTAASRDEGLRLAEVAARERLEHLYSLAMEAWQNSQEDEITTRQEGMMARTTRVVKRSHGKICYLNVAAKISDMLLDVPIRFVPGWMEAGAEADAPVRFELDAGERYDRELRRQQENATAAPRWTGLDHPDAGVQPSPRASHPPVRDCSPLAASEVPGTDQLLEGFDAMLNAVESSAQCREQFQQSMEARARLFTPVHSDEEDEADEDELSFEEAAQRVLQQPIAMHEPPRPTQPKSAGRPLSRKERKARQRLLAKRKKRASG